MLFTWKADGSSLCKHSQVVNKRRSLINRLWNTSPRSLTEALRRRLRRERPAAGQVLDWVKVRGGSLAGAELLLAPALSPDWREMAEGTFDSYCIEPLKAEGSLAGRTVWDVGAHFGYHTLCFAQLVGESGRVFAFEPNPANLHRLRLHLERNTELAKRIVVVPKAAAAQDGHTTLVFSDEVETGESSCSYVDGALLPRTPETYSQFRQQTVPTVTLDSFLDSGCSAPPSVVKIDVEGAEWLVLQAARRLLATQAPTLLIEVHNIRLMFEVQRLLASSGYELELVGQAHATPSRCFVLARGAGGSLGRQTSGVKG